MAFPDCADRVGLMGFSEHGTGGSLRCQAGERIDLGFLAE